MPLKPTKVYPRECGATYEKSFGSSLIYGLSPRVRGNQNHKYDPRLPMRSIPASAGQPALHDFGAEDNKVYPRECGATFVVLVFSPLQEGLSPRVRGNRPTID